MKRRALSQNGWVQIQPGQFVLCRPGRSSLPSELLSRMSVKVVGLGNSVSESTHCLTASVRISQMAAVTKILLTAHFVILAAKIMVLGLK